MPDFSAARWVYRKFWGFWGQVRRKWLCTFRPTKVRMARDRRRGACKGCGKCCNLVFRCPFLDENKRCSIYERRFEACAAFPIDERDIRNLDCGFFFEPRKETGRIWGLPLAPWAKKEIALAGMVFLVGGGAGLAIARLDGLPAGYALTAVFGALFLFTLMFFRDPSRATPPGDADLLAPADGRVTDVEEVEEGEFIGGKGLRVGIFMSLFNVHVNRTPCTGEVRFMRHRDGEWGNVMFKKAWARNENLLIGLEGERGPLALRLVAGAVARRIECGLKPGTRVERGNRIGMVKFGSRAEVIVPVASGWTAVVAKGQKVKAGVSSLFIRRAPGETVEESRK